MAAEKSVRECFTASPCPILREDELMSRCKQIDKSKLQECLLCMISRGDLGTRTVLSNHSEVTIYWLKNGDRPVSTPSNLAGGSFRSRWSLKRSRSPFVSPLISSTTEGVSIKGGEKRPKLTVALSGTNKQTLPEPSCSDSARGKLDFTSSQPHTRDSSVTSVSDETAQAKTTVDHETPTSTGGPSSDSLNTASCLVTDESVKQLLEEEQTLQRQLTDKKEELRKLKMVKLFRAKNELQGLDQLTIKWRNAAQEVAEMLLENLTSEPRPTMKQLLDYHRIECSLIQYSSEEESFY